MILTETITYESLVRSFDLQKNDTVLLASDLTRLARVFKSTGIPFSADVFLNHLQRSLSEGTLIIPAYTDYLKNGDTFDRQKSKPSTGSLANRVMRRKDYLRTSDPLHSVFVCGKKSNELLKLHDTSTFGVNSVFGFLDQEAAKMVILDVDFDHSFTFVHYIEEKLKVRFRKPYRWKIRVIDDGIEEWRHLTFYTKRKGFTVDLRHLQSELIKKGVVKRFVYADVPILVVDLQRSGIEIEKYIKEGGKTYGFDVMLFVRQLVKKIIGRE